MRFHIQELSSTTKANMNLVPYFIITDGQTRNKYHIRLDMHTQPYHPHYIPPNWGGTLPQGTQNSVPSPLSPPEKASIPQIEI